MSCLSDSCRVRGLGRTLTPLVEDLNAAGIGVMVHNSHGEVLAALAKIIPLPSLVLVLETLAA